MKKTFLLLCFVFCAIFCEGQNTPQPQVLQDIYPESLFSANFQNSLFRNRFVFVESGADTVVWFVDVNGNRALMPMGASGGGGGVNIYNSDGTLTANRTITGAAKSLTISGLSTYNLSGSGNIGIESTGANTSINSLVGSVSLSGDDITINAGINGFNANCPDGGFSFFGGTFYSDQGIGQTYLKSNEIVFQADNLLGANYFADYGATMRANARSLIDVGNSKILIKDSLGIHTQSGRYTPTVSASTNLDLAATVTQAQFSRVNGVVTVSGRFTADPTTNAVATSFKITLPIASNIGAVEDCAGVGFCGAIAGMGCQVSGVAADDTAIFNWIASDTTSKTWSFTFTYEIL